MRVGHVFGAIAAGSLLLPAAGRLIGRNFNGFAISSETILSDSSRTVAAVVAFFFAAILIVIRGGSGLDLPAARHRWLKWSLSAFVLIFVASSILGLVEHNTLGYIVTDDFNMGFWLITFALGYVVGLRKFSTEALLIGFAVIGSCVVGFEIVYAIGFGSLLPIRYGSGLGLPVMAVSLITSSAFRRTQWVPLIVIVGGLYVLGSSSRTDVAVLVVTLLIFFLLRHRLDATAPGIDLKRVFMSLALGVGSIVVAISVAGWIGLTDRNSSAFDSLLARAQGTVQSGGSQISLADISGVLDLQNNLDESTWLRFVEAGSAIAAQKSTVIGNGLGASFDNGRGAFLNYDISDHYIHITPVLIFFRQGALGLFSWLLVMVTVVGFCIRSMRENEVVVRATAMTALILLVQAGLDFFVASGSFFPEFAIVMAFVGACFSQQTMLGWQARRAVEENCAGAE